MALLNGVLREWVCVRAVIFTRTFFAHDTLDAEGHTGKRVGSRLRCTMRTNAACRKRQATLLFPRLKFEAAMEALTRAHEAEMEEAIAALKKELAELQAEKSSPTILVEPREVRVTLETHREHHVTQAGRSSFTECLDPRADSHGMSSCTAEISDSGSELLMANVRRRMGRDVTTSSASQDVQGVATPLQTKSTRQVLHTSCPHEERCITLGWIMLLGVCSTRGMSSPDFDRNIRNSFMCLEN